MSIDIYKLDKNSNNSIKYDDKSNKPIYNIQDKNFITSNINNHNLSLLASLTNYNNNDNNIINNKLKFKESSTSNLTKNLKKTSSLVINLKSYLKKIIDSKYKNRRKIYHLVKSIKEKLYKSYYLSKDFYFKKIISDLINKSKCHYYIQYSDMLIFNDSSEYLEKYYNWSMTFFKLNSISKYYFNSIKIFPNFFKLNTERNIILANIYSKQRLINNFISVYTKNNDKDNLNKEASSLPNNDRKKDEYGSNINVLNTYSRINATNNLDTYYNDFSYSLFLKSDLIDEINSDDKSVYFSKGNNNYNKQKLYINKNLLNSKNKINLKNNYYDNVNNSKSYNNRNKFRRSCIDDIIILINKINININNHSINKNKIPTHAKSKFSISKNYVIKNSIKLNLNNATNYLTNHNYSCISEEQSNSILNKNITNYNETSRFSYYKENSSLCKNTNKLKKRCSRNSINDNINSLLLNESKSKSAKNILHNKKSSKELFNNDYLLKYFNQSRILSSKALHSYSSLNDVKNSNIKIPNRLQHLTINNNNKLKTIEEADNEFKYNSIFIKNNILNIDNNNFVNIASKNNSFAKLNTTDLIKAKITNNKKQLTVNINNKNNLKQNSIYNTFINNIKISNIKKNNTKISNIFKNTVRSSFIYNAKSYKNNSQMNYFTSNRKSIIDDFKMNIKHDSIDKINSKIRKSLKPCTVKVRYIDDEYNILNNVNNIINDNVKTKDSNIELSSSKMLNLANKNNLNSHKSTKQKSNDGKNCKTDYFTFNNDNNNEINNKLEKTNRTSFTNNNKSLSCNNNKDKYYITNNSINTNKKELNISNELDIAITSIDQNSPVNNELNNTSLNKNKDNSKLSPSIDNKTSLITRENNNKKLYKQSKNLLYNNKSISYKHLNYCKKNENDSFNLHKIDYSLSNNYDVIINKNKSKHYTSKNILNISSKRNIIKSTNVDINNKSIIQLQSYISKKEKEKRNSSFNLINSNSHINNNLKFESLFHSKQLDASNNYNINKTEQINLSNSFNNDSDKDIDITTHKISNLSNNTKLIDYKTNSKDKLINSYQKKLIDLNNKYVDYNIREIESKPLDNDQYSNLKAYNSNDKNYNTYVLKDLNFKEDIKLIYNKNFNSNSNKKNNNKFNYLNENKSTNRVSFVESSIISYKNNIKKLKINTNLKNNNINSNTSDSNIYTNSINKIKTINFPSNISNKLTANKEDISPILNTNYSNNSNNNNNNNFFNFNKKYSNLKKEYSNVLEYKRNDFKFENLEKFLSNKNNNINSIKEINSFRKDNKLSNYKVFQNCTLIKDNSNNNNSNYHTKQKQSKIDLNSYSLINQNSLTNNNKTFNIKQDFLNKENKIIKNIKSIALKKAFINNAKLKLKNKYNRISNINSKDVTKANNKFIDTNYAYLNDNNSNFNAYNVLTLKKCNIILNNQNNSSNIISNLSNCVNIKNENIKSDIIKLNSRIDINKYNKNKRPATTNHKSILNYNNNNKLLFTNTYLKSKL